jgi:hypothetical protein
VCDPGSFLGCDGLGDEGGGGERENDTLHGLLL